MNNEANRRRLVWPLCHLNKTERKLTDYNELNYSLTVRSPVEFYIFVCPAFIQFIFEGIYVTSVTESGKLYHI